MLGLKRNTTALEGERQDPVLITCFIINSSIHQFIISNTAFLNRQQCQRLPSAEAPPEGANNAATIFSPSRFTPSRFIEYLLVLKKRPRG